MANLWEQKIGSHKTHSPRTVVDSVKKSGGQQSETVTLTKAGTSLIGEELQKKDTNSKETGIGKCVCFFFQSAPTWCGAVSVKPCCRLFLPVNEFLLLCWLERGKAVLDVTASRDTELGESSILEKSTKESGPGELSTLVMIVHSEKFV